MHAAALRGIVASTLIIQGDADAAGASCGRVYAQAIPGARLVVAQGAGHFTHADPVRFPAGEGVLQEQTGDMELPIGEFSRVSRLPVETIRYYQEEGILLPRCTDPDSGYRYRDGAALEQARVVKKLRDLEFSIAEIRELLSGYEPGWRTAGLQRKAQKFDKTIAHYKVAKRE